jgi:hypothetical protein
MRRFENGPDSYAERLAKSIAVVDAEPGALATHLADALKAAAVQARSPTGRTIPSGKRSAASSPWNGSARRTEQG